MKLFENQCLIPQFKLSLHGPRNIKEEWISMLDPEIHSTKVKNRDQSLILNTKVKTRDQCLILNTEVKTRDQCLILNTEVKSRDQCLILNTDVKTVILKLKSKLSSSKLDPTL